MSIAALLKSLEESLLDSAVRGSPEMLNALLADDFREFGSSGRVFTKSQIIAELQTQRYTPLVAADFEMRLLAPGVALVTYKTMPDGGGVSQPASAALRSSLWIERDGRWQVIFHQGTRTAAAGF